MNTTTTNGVESRPANGQPMSLAEYLDDEARAYRSQDTAEAALVAETLERLAQLVRWTGATTPDEHEARMAIWDDSIREAEYQRGRDEGREDLLFGLTGHIPA